ncbi:hypothetical protein P692DRAFT_20749427 [Suillus brevipes Sb2]|nr:hypothetical protein P692DRAFT_20749427 [Suillus brevipes Sb2]
MYNKYKNSLIDDFLPEPAAAIWLARVCNILSILPAAFYHLSHLSIEDNQCNSLTSSIHLEPEVPYQHSFYGNCTMDWTILSSQDYMCLLQGKAKLMSAADQPFSASHMDND